MNAQQRAAKMQEFLDKPVNANFKRENPEIPILVRSLARGNLDYEWVEPDEAADKLEQVLKEVGYGL